MKSCFVVTQIYPTTHVPLTLHQVVRLLSPQKPAATVIIQDKIVHIEDIYETLFQKIWAIMLSGHVEYCTTHKNERNDFGLFPNYNNIRHKLKLWVTELVSADY